MDKNGGWWKCTWIEKWMWNEKFCDKRSSHFIILKLVWLKLLWYDESFIMYPSQHNIGIYQKNNWKELEVFKCFWMNNGDDENACELKTVVVYCHFILNWIALIIKYSSFTTSIWHLSFTSCNFCYVLFCFFPMLFWLFY